MTAPVLRLGLQLIDPLSAAIFTRGARRGGQRPELSRAARGAAGRRPGTFRVPARAAAGVLSAASLQPNKVCGAAEFVPALWSWSCHDVQL